MAENEDGMVEITLRRSVQVRAPGGGVTESYGPGTVMVPTGVAHSLGAIVAAQPPRSATTGMTGGPAPSGTDLAPKGEAGPQGGSEGGNDNSKANDPFAEMSKEDLESEAELRGLDVKRTDGKDGAPRKEDLLAALRDHEGSKGQ